MLSFKIFNNIDDECEKIWRKLETNSINDYFQTFEYNFELINNYNLNRLNIIVIYWDKEPVALLPLHIKKYFFIKFLTFISTKYSDYSNPIISSKFIDNIDRQSFLNIWGEIIKKIGKFDIIFFNNQLSIIDKLNNPFVKYLNFKKFSSIYHIILPSTFEFYKQDILKKSKNHHYEIHRTLLKKEKLKKNYQINFDINILNNSELKIDKLIKNKIKEIAIKKKKGNLNFKIINLYNNLNKKDKNKFLIATFKINAEIVSACLCIRFNNIIYYYMPIILSKKYESFKIGKILLLEIINWCTKMNISKLDFGLGAERYKKYFSNFDLELFRFYNFKSLKGFIIFLFLKIIL